MANKTGIYILGGLAVAGIIAYFLFKPNGPPTPPPTEVTARIDNFAIGVV